MIETYYRILKHDSKGKKVYDSGLIPSHSYVIQFLELMRAFFVHTSTTVTDVAGAESRIYYSSDNWQGTGYLLAGAGDDAFGTVVGINTGASPEDNEDYALDTKILHSAIGDAGKLNYQAVTLVAPSVQGANVDFDITRTFLNETGGTITVKEIGLICKNVFDTEYHLLLRDVVSDEAVLDGYTLTVVYTLRTTV